MEVLVSVVVLAIGLMAHMSATLGEHRMVREQEYRSGGLLVARQLAERIRADDDWNGLYARLKLLMEQAATPGATAVRLADGREAYPPQAYYADFVLGQDMQDACVLVDVPASPLPLAPSGPKVLREDVTDARFGLPYDLDGDGTIGSTACDTTYLALPLRIHVRWVPPGEGSREIHVDTWVRGER